MIPYEDKLKRIQERYTTTSLLFSITLTAAANESTYQFFASFVLFSHFMLKVFTFFALFLEFKFLHETNISRSASPHSYDA